MFSNAFFFFFSCIKVTYNDVYMTQSQIYLNWKFIVLQNLTRLTQRHHVLIEYNDYTAKKSRHCVWTKVESKLNEIN